jgi:hypothetical protein
MREGARERRLTCVSPRPVLVRSDCERDDERKDHTVDDQCPHTRPLIVTLPPPAAHRQPDRALSADSAHVRQFGVWTASGCCSAHYPTSGGTSCIVSMACPLSRLGDGRHRRAAARGFTWGMHRVTPLHHTRSVARHVQTRRASGGPAARCTGTVGGRAEPPGAIRSPASRGGYGLRKREPLT